MKKILLLCCFMIASAYPQYVELKAVGLSGGAFWAQNGWDPGVAVEVNLDMGEVLDFIFMQPTIAYMQAAKTAEKNGIEADLTLRHVIFGTKLLGYITSRPQGLYVGSAINYHFITSEILQELQLSNSAQLNTLENNKVSLSLLSGYLQKFRRFSVFVELRYSLIPDNFSTAVVTSGFLYHL